MDYQKKALVRHKQLRGKIYIGIKDNLNSKSKLSTYYTPGVAAVSKLIADNPNEARDYTWLGNTVAIVSDGSAVLGLGNIGPYGALPVMEGKAMIFKNFADIDAVPIVLNTHTPEKIIAAVKAIAPSFGGINLEDIAAPACFEIENELKKSLDIPVFHDDQHGTAVVVLAGLINACKLTKRSLADSRIIISGAGAAGTATARLIKKYAPLVTVVMLDSQGVINHNRADLNEHKKELLKSKVIKDYVTGGLGEVIAGADIFIGVSQAGILKPAMVRSMNKMPIIFAMANPDPEILPIEAKKAGAVVIATGRSDFPNQVNNALAFPGIFRGALDNRVSKITEQHKIAAAKAIAGLVNTPTFDCIIPEVQNKSLVNKIARVIT